MRRRDLLRHLGLAGGGALVAPGLLEALQERDLTDEEVEALLRGLAGIEPRPGEAARVREALAGRKPPEDSDPGVQPALAFNPEVELPETEPDDGEGSA